MKNLFRLSKNDNIVLEQAGVPRPRGLEICGKSAYNIEFSWKARMIILGVVRETNIRNIHWFSVMTIIPKWPIIAWVRDFVIDDE